MPNGAKHWVFTLNNYDDADEAQIESLVPPHAAYAIFGREVGENGTPHLQGYIAFNRRTTLAAAKALLSQRYHLEVRRGTQVQAIDYCKKDGDFSEFGERPLDQGHRSDISQFKEWLKARPLPPSEREIADEHFALWMRYPKQCVRARDLLSPPQALELEPCRAWQQDLLDGVAQPAPQRIVLFYVDLNGGVGKSWLMRKILTDLPHETQVLGIGKSSDIVHAVDISKSIFIFDIPRGGMEFLNYGTLEKLKDRVLFSSKYDSCMKILRVTPHVIVFCNEHPDHTKMTADRYLIIDEFN